MSDKQEPVKIEDMDQPAEELTDEQAEDTKGGASADFYLKIDAVSGDSTRSTSNAEPPDRSSR